MDNERIPAAVAKAAAGKIIQLLAPVCERIAYAGSLRRGEPLVKDVAIVCIPKTIETVKKPAAANLFTEEPAETGLERVKEWETRVQQIGRIVKGKPGGKMIQW